ncbi:MAG TPA: hypothetical protein PLN67_08415, partial [Acidovorax defluvii]|nr:hypothetical protein [Acidovorax defluvii]
PNQTQNHTFLQTFFSTTQTNPTGTPLNSEAYDYSMEKLTPEAGRRFFASQRNTDSRHDASQAKCTARHDPPPPNTNRQLSLP